MIDGGFIPRVDRDLTHNIAPSQVGRLGEDIAVAQISTTSFLLLLVMLDLGWRYQKDGGR